MTNFLPIFPLQVVVYPGEPLNLHIFEPRYKQLIRECIESKKAFGIPPVLQSGMGEWGTVVEVAELVKEYENGEMDVRTRGVSVFRMLEVVREIPDKLYSGAIVTHPRNIVAADESGVAQLILSEVRRLYELMNLDRKVADAGETPLSYRIAHFVGLNLEQEYEVLMLLTEIQRLEYLRRHLANMAPMVAELEAMKARVQRNGHFRDLTLGDLKF